MRSVVVIAWMIAAPALGAGVTLQTLISGGNLPEGTSSWLHVGFGGGALVVPLNVNTPHSAFLPQSTSGRLSTTVGPTLDVWFYPLFSQTAGLAVDGDLFAGYLPAENGSEWNNVWRVGLRGFTGRDEGWALTADVHWRHLAASYVSGTSAGTLFGDTLYSQGSGRIDAIDVGVGGHGCTDRLGLFCERSFEFGAFASLVDGSASASAVGLRLTWIRRTGVTIDAEVSWGYRYAGAALYANTGFNGVSAHLFIETNFDWFSGHPGRPLRLSL